MATKSTRKHPVKAIKVKDVSGTQVKGGAVDAFRN